MTSNVDNRSAQDQIRRSPEFAATEAWTQLAEEAIQQGMGPAVRRARVFGRLVQLFVNESNQPASVAFPRAVVFADRCMAEAGDGYTDANREAALSLLGRGWFYGDLLYTL